MPIIEAPFDNERELESWFFKNSATFFPGATVVHGFAISTISGKGGVPDAFSFNFASRQWHVIECELQCHGVWPHIAEQITRFVVALQNPETLRVIRDRLFEHILANNMIASAVAALKTDQARLLQQVELFIENVPPSLAIFIDDANQDLSDMAHALNTPSEIFRVRKLISDGVVQYYSPDTKQPAVQVNTDDGQGTKTRDYDVLDILGGATLERAIGRVKCYRLPDNAVVIVKRSKYYENNGYFWYGINAGTLEAMEQAGVTHVVFILGDYGFAKVPLNIVHDYLKTALRTDNEDGSLKHYHCLISPPPEPDLFTSQEAPRFPLVDCFQTFE